MGKPFEVKEFDSIICNADYKDDEKYKYLHKNIFWNLANFLVQNVLSVPIKELYAKLKFRIKYIGKEKLKKYKKSKKVLAKVTAL